MGVKLNTDFTVGTGSSQPRGITLDTTLGVTGGTTVVGVFTADNLIDLVYSVNPAYRAQPGCAWMMRDASIAATRKLKDTQNRYLFEPSLQLGQPDTLLGYALRSNPDVAATALNAKSVVFGVVPKYYVRQVGGLRLDRSDDFAFSSDLITFRASLRADGALIDTTGAVKHFVGAAS
jgi:HK97 family phage major capsid protein